MSKRPELPKMRGVDNLLSFDPTAESKPADFLTLDEIIDRPMDTRSLNSTHVNALTESIAALGLIQPIAVDNSGQLLAGGHRLAAITQLQATNPTAFAQHFSGGIPVRRYDFAAMDDPDLALAIEATENEKRRDYTAQEVRGLADRLKAAGYHHTKGRAKTGDKSLIPSLAVIVGKSERQINRYLAPEPPTKLNTTHVAFNDKYLKQAIIALQQYEKTGSDTPKKQKLLVDLPGIIANLERAIEQEQ
jgi:ParB family transcriptional regulator, chromosome partitioning protein